jgi:hypothetical protein
MIEIMKWNEKIIYYCQKRKAVIQWMEYKKKPHMGTRPVRGASSTWLRLIKKQYDYNKSLLKQNYNKNINKKKYKYILSIKKIILPKNRVREPHIKYIFLNVTVIIEVVI